MCLLEPLSVVIHASHSLAQSRVGPFYREKFLFLLLKSQFLIDLDLCLKNLLVQRCQQFLGPVHNVFVNFGGQRGPLHLLVPHVDNNKDVFHSHLLQQ